MITNIRYIQMGTGTSAGVPSIGCDCSVCRSEDPRDHRLRCGACLQFDDPDGNRRVILIDTPPDHRQQALRHGLDRCDGIVFTHDHVDHVFGLDEVRRYNAMMKCPIDIYAEPDVLGSLGRMFRHVFDRGENVNDSFVASLVPNTVEPGVPFELHGLRIEPIRVLHGRLPILGYRFDAVEEGDAPDVLPLAYLSDVSALPPEAWPRLEDLRTLVLDMLRYRSHPTHLTVDRAIEVASRVDAGSTYFIHMSHDISHGELDPRLPERMHLAWDGLVLPRG